MRLKLSLVAIAIALTLSLIPLSIQAQVVQEYELSIQGPFVGIESGRPTGTVPGFGLNTTNLTLAYDFETVDGSENLIDLSGNDNTAYRSTVPADIGGQFGRARDMGANARYDASGITAADQEVTMLQVFWVQSLFSYRSLWSMGSGAGSMAILIDGGGGIRFRVWNATAVLFEIDSGSGDVIAQTWHILASSYYADSSRRVVIDGQIIIDAGPITEPADALTIGAERIGTNIVDSLRADEHFRLDRALSEQELIDVTIGGHEYNFRYETEEIVPSDVSTGHNYIMGSNLTWGAENSTFTPLTFTTNASVWFEGESLGAISWDSYSNITDAEIDFNLTMPLGTYPYWVNDTLQGNLTTIAGAIDFNWTDWIDGEHLFELGFEIVTTPSSLTGVEGDIFTYDPESSKTDVTWSLEAGPEWIFIDSATGLLAGVMEPGGFIITIEALASGGISQSQSFALVVTPSIDDLIILIMLPLIITLFALAPIFNLPTLWMLDGIITMMFGLWTFLDLGFPFYFAVGIMTFGGILLMGGLVYSLSMRGMLGKREKT